MTTDSQLDAYFAAKPARYLSTQEDSQMDRRIIDIKHHHGDGPEATERRDLQRQAYHWLLGEDVAPASLADAVRQQEAVRAQPLSGQDLADESRRIADAVPWEALDSTEGCAGTSEADAPPFRPAWSGQRFGNVVGGIVGFGMLIGAAAWWLLSR